MSEKLPIRLMNYAQCQGCVWVIRGTPAPLSNC